jgi:hypothetical protein
VIRHLVLDKGALALAIGMGGLILLLLAGTQVLDWYWPVLLAAVSLGIGIYQLRKHIPSRYQLAQRIDQKMALADSLSTAVYFSEHPKPGFEATIAKQYHAADGLAATVPLERALPMARSRYLLPAVGLFAIAAGLFVTRYLVMGSLDLRNSMVEMAVDTFFASPPETVAKVTRPDLRARPFDPEQPLAPQESQIPIPPDAEKGKELADTQQKQDSANADQPGDEKGDNGDLDSKDSKQDSNKDKQNDRQGDDKGSNDSQGDDQRSMLDKLRDAAQNLINKFSSNEQKQQTAKNDSQQKGQKSDKAGKGDDDANQDSQADAQPNSDEAGGKGKPNPKQAESQQDQKSGEKGASGAGDNNGKKDLEAAKAEEAMGKVSELLTQRSAATSGEMMVEVGQTKQELKTALTQQKAGHSDSGGEIHRDQVPLADQMFIERYFQEIRKSSGDAKAKTGDAKAAVKNGDGKAKSN